MYKFCTYRLVNLTICWRSFWKTFAKFNGEEYEPNTLSGLQRNIQRLLSDGKYPFNILQDKIFKKSRQVLAAKRKNLVASSVSSLTNEEEGKLFESGRDEYRSPINFYKLFKSLHSKAFQKSQTRGNESTRFPILLAVRHGSRGKRSEIWYMIVSLGKNQIGKFLSTAAENAGIQRVEQKSATILFAKQYLKAARRQYTREFCSSVRWAQKHSKFAVVKISEWTAPATDVAHPYQNARSSFARSLCQVLILWIYTIRL